MISCIKGKIINKGENAVIVEVNGLGLNINVFNVEQFVVNKEVSLFIYMHWHQEQGPSLFGFSSELEKIIFILIISCSGVGPKMAMSILSQMSPESFIDAIRSEDKKRLSALNGIGGKKAEQLIFQLKSKTAGLKIEGARDLEISKDIAGVLSSLKYSKQEIEIAMQYLYKNKIDNFNEALRKVLNFLSKRF